MVASFSSMEAVAVERAALAVERAAVVVEA